MDHFSSRTAQAPQQHVYGTSGYSIYSSQPPYLTGTGPYPVPHQQTVSFQQGPSHYTRSSVGSAPITAGSVQQRRGGNSLGTNGMSHGGGLRQGSMPSASISHHNIQHPSNIAGDASHSIAPLAATLVQHPRIAPELPLRIVVDSRYVGAIIGQAGTNIREITKESKARCVVDTQRPTRDFIGNSEKVISILGIPENCSLACLKILEVIRKEMEKDSTAALHPEIELKIRAHNQLVGRLIGRGGATIKRIMEETGAQIFVSKDPTFTRSSYGMVSPYAGSPVYGTDVAMHIERTVTVKAADMATISAAEQRISQKLRQSYETDLISNATLYQATGTTATVPLLASVNDPTYLNAVNIAPTYLRSAAVGALQAAAPQGLRTVNMWVPNNMVGALIGAKGVHIRNAIRLTGAQLRIEGGGISREKKDDSDTRNQKDSKEGVVSESEKIDPVEENMRVANESAEEQSNSKEKTNEKSVENFEKSDSSSKQTKEKDTHMDERLVTITGNDPQQFKAQYWVYQRIAEQTLHYVDDVRLCTEVSVPSKLVGRIIGKGGQNVRELQRTTGAQVKIPDDAGEDESQKTTIVRVVGNFHSSQAVQFRLSQLISDFAQRLNFTPANGQSTSNAQGSSPGL